MSARSSALFTVCRADIETFTGDLERAQARAAVTRRLCTIAGSCKYAVEEEILDHSPAAYVRRPRVDYESHAVGLDRNKLGALLAAAGLGGKVVTIPLAPRGARAIDLVTRKRCDGALSSAPPVVGGWTGAAPADRPQGRAG